MISPQIRSRSRSFCGTVSIGKGTVETELVIRRRSLKDQDGQHCKRGRKDEERTERLLDLFAGSEEPEVYECGDGYAGYSVPAKVIHQLEW